MFSVSSRPEFLPNNMCKHWQMESHTGHSNLRVPQGLVTQLLQMPHSLLTVQTSSDTVSQCLWTCSAITSAKILFVAKSYPLSSHPTRADQKSKTFSHKHGGRTGLPCPFFWSPHGHQLKKVENRN